MSGKFHVIQRVDALVVRDIDGVAKLDLSLDLLGDHADELVETLFSEDFLEEIARGREMNNLMHGVIIGLEIGDFLF